jgi:hypothetical protein
MPSTCAGQSGSRDDLDKICAALDCTVANLLEA